MGDVFAKHAASLANLEKYYGAGVSLFTWGAISGPCLSSSLTEGKELGFGGFGKDAALRIVIRAILFGDPNADPTPAIPLPKQDISFQRTAAIPARLLRIEKVIEASDQMIVLICIDPTKGV